MAFYITTRRDTMSHLMPFLSICTDRVTVYQQTACRSGVGTDPAQQLAMLHRTVLASLSISVTTAPCGCGSKPPADNRPDASPTQATEPDYALVYDTSVVHRYELEIDPAVWQSMLADPESNEYVEATFRYDDEVYTQVGVRFKGNSSRFWVTLNGGTRYSLKVKFNEFVDGQTFHGVKKLDLHNGKGDPSFMRERLSYDLFRDLGVPSSRVAYADLYLNGNLHGLYISVEQVNKDFLEQWFGDNEGNLYKPESGNLIYHGDNIETYPPNQDYQLKTNESAADYSGLLHFMEVLNNTPDEEFAAAIEEVFEVEPFLKWLAASALLLPLDSYLGMSEHNYYLYDNPSTGRFAWIPWDLSDSFAAVGCLRPEATLRLGTNVPYCFDPRVPAASIRPLIARILAVDSYRAQYEQLLEELLTGQFSQATINDELERWQALIADHVQADPTRFFTYDEFERGLVAGSAGVFGLRSFVSARGGFMRASLDGTLAVVCGDDICDGGESCESDCPSPMP